MPPAEFTESAAVAFLCQRLPDLRRRAAAGYWTDRLELNVDEVVAGGSGVAACRDLGLLESTPAGPSRGDPPGSDGARMHGLEPVTIVGDYRCPNGRCARRADRDEQARVPECHLTGTPMVFQPRR